MPDKYYKTLGVSKDATDIEIKTAYRQLAKKYHPDSNLDNKEAEEIFKELNEAYDVLSNSQKRQQYDEKTNNSTKQKTYNNKSNDDIFNNNRKEYNPVSDEDILQYNLEREKYINFLNDIEPRFNEYNKSLKKEKENILNSKNYPINTFNFFIDKRREVEGWLNDLERNVKAFEYHLQLLDEMEPKFNEYNKTIVNFKERMKGKKGDIFANKIYAEQADLKNALFKLERNSKAFDSFSKYYNSRNQEVKDLYSGTLTNFDKYLNPKNRCSFEPNIFENLEIKIRNIVYDLSSKREKKLNQLIEKLKKKNFNINTYLDIRGTSQLTISVKDISTLLKSMSLIDEINDNLMKFEITIEEFLNTRGKLLIDMNYKELMIINEAISEFIKDNKDIDIDSLNAITFEEDEEVIINSGKNK